MAKHHHHFYSTFGRGDVSYDLHTETDTGFLPTTGINTVHRQVERHIRRQLLPRLQDLACLPPPELLADDPTSVTVPIREALTAPGVTANLIIEVTLDVGLKEKYVHELVHDIMVTDVRSRLRQWSKTCASS